MRLIRKNVEREAEGSAAEKLISDGFTPMKEATPDTVPEEKIGKDIEDMTVEELKTLATHDWKHFIPQFIKALLELRDQRETLALLVLRV